MSAEEDQARLREHVAELRRAARGIGKDIELDLAAAGRRIEELPKLTARDAKELAWAIEDDLAVAGKKVGVELRRMPREIGHGLAVAGTDIKDGAMRVGGATRDAVEEAGHRTKEGAKNAFAAAAGLKRTPMKRWSPPTEDEKEQGGA